MAALSQQVLPGSLNQHENSSELNLLVNFDSKNWKAFLGSDPLSEFKVLELLDS